MLTSQSNLLMLRRARADLDLRTISSKTSRGHIRLPIKMRMMEAAARKTRWIMSTMNQKERVPIRWWRMDKVAPLQRQIDAVKRKAELDRNRKGTPILDRCVMVMLPVPTRHEPFKLPTDKRWSRKPTNEEPILFQVTPISPGACLELADFRTHLRLSELK